MGGSEGYKGRCGGPSKNNKKKKKKKKKKKLMKKQKYFLLIHAPHYVAGSRSDGESSL